MRATFWQVGADGRVDAEVRQMRAGVRSWVAGLARRAGSEVERRSPTGLVAMLCASAVAPIVAAGDAGAVAATAGVLGSVGANVLSRVVDDAISRLRAAGDGEPSSNDVVRVLGERIEAVLVAGDETARRLGHEIGVVLGEIGAAEEALRAAVESGDAALCERVTDGFAALAREAEVSRGLLEDVSTAVAMLQESLREEGAARRRESDTSRQILMQLRHLRVEITDVLDPTRHGGSEPGRLAEGSASRWAGGCPYRGLSPFTEEHADVFFGRAQVTDALIEKLAERLAGPSVVVVTGPSGVGKSSLLRAGLLPALARGALDARGSEWWPQVALTPTARPLDELASRLAHLGGLEPGEVRGGLAEHPEDSHLLCRRVVLEHGRPPGRPSGWHGSAAGPGRSAAPVLDDARVVLLVDQFEQVFALHERPRVDALETEAFVTALIAAATTPCGPRGMPSALVVLSVRGDYWDRCAAHPRLTGLLQDGGFVVGPMAEPELRRTITGPAAVAGLEIEDGLVHHVLGELRAPDGGLDVTALALVSQTMRNTWERRTGKRLTVRAYEASGGVARAIQASAESVYDDLSPAEQTIARIVFVALTAVTRERELVRRPVAVEALRTALGREDDGGLDAVLAAFTDKRLLVRDAGTVEIAHDLLLTAWPRLRDWLSGDREGMVRHSQLVDRARAWLAADRDPSYLHRGAELAAAGQLRDSWEPVADRLPAFDETAREFIAASADAERRRRRRSRATVAALASVVAITLVLATLFGYQRRVARREESVASSRALATLSADAATADTGLSMMLALAAYQRHPTTEAENALFRNYVDFRHVDAVLSGARGGIEQVDVGGDGRVVAARTSLGLVTVWIRRPGRPVTTRHLATAQAGERAQGREAVTQAVLVDVTDDGRGVLIGENERAWYYDVASGERRWDLPLSGRLYSAAIRDDGAAVLEVRGETSNRLQLWDTAGRRPRLVAELAAPASRLTPLVGFGPDADTVLFTSTTDNDTYPLVLWNATTGARRTIAQDAPLPTPATNGVVALCGGTYPRHVVTLVDVGRRTERRFPLPETMTCNEMVIGSDAEVVVTADGAVSIDVASGEMAVQPPPPTEVDLLAGVVTEGRRRLIVSHDIAHVVLREVVTDDEFVLGLPDEPGDVESSLRLTADGQHVVGVSDRGRRIVATRASGDGADFDITAAADRPPPYRQPGLGDLAINREGSLVADRVADNKVQVRRLPDLQLVSEVTTPPVATEPETSIPVVTFAGGRLLTTFGTRAQWSNPSTGEQVAELDLVATGIADADDVVSIDPHADPARVAVTIAGDPDVRILEVATGRQVDAIEVGDDVLATNFQANTPYFALYRSGGRIEVWDAEQRRRVVGPLTGFDADVTVPLPGIGFTVGFLTEPGEYFVGRGGGGLLRGGGGQLRWYRAGSPAPERALELGEGRSSSRQPVAISADAATLLLAEGVPYAYGDTLAATVTLLRLHPNDWRDHLCSLLEGRTFTDDEAAALADDIRSRPLC